MPAVTRSLGHYFYKETWNQDVPSDLALRPIVTIDLNKCGYKLTITENADGSKSYKLETK